MIEARVKIPDLDLGGWPAVWLLGTTNYAWPRSGEMDMMEMGGKQVFRDLHDTHNGGNGLDNATVNEAVGANAIFYTDAAVNPQNPSGAASLSYYFNYANPLIDRFLVYRLYWDQDMLRFTVIDDGVEHDLYASPFEIDTESEEFRAPFYFIANLAIGGAFTDAYNLGDPGSGAPVSMPLPAEMLIDYIRVYEWNGQGDVHLGPPTPKSGVFGLFTETTPTNDELVPDVSSQIYVWEGTLTGGSIPPYEGANVLSWQTTGLGWFGAGIMSIQPLNLFEFGDGDLKFRIKIPAHVTFKVGIIDAWGNQSYVSFPGHQTAFGLVRDGEWGQASIPVSVIRGIAMDLRMLSYSFVILEENGLPCEFALDDIYWDSGVITGTDGGSVTRRVQLYENVPNPFNPSTKIRFELPAAGDYEIVIFDTAGRRVKALRGQGVAGANSVRWDGRDAAGHAVASGVYPYQLISPEGRAARKMLLVK